MRVAVTGAAGYLGRALVAALDDVVAIDLRPPPAADGVRPVTRDVRDPELAAELEGADALVHLAYVVLGRGANAQSVNVEGSRNVFEAAARAGVGTIVHASSAAAYGCAPDNPVPLSEDAPLRPLPAFYYPQTKVAVERVLDAFEAAHPQVRVARLRPIAVLGPGAPAFLGGRAFVTLSDFDPLMQFVALGDFVELVKRVLSEPVGGAFNVGGPEPVRASTVARLMGVRSARAPHRVLRAAARVGAALRLPGTMHPGWVDMARYPIVVSTERAERELGWRASSDSAEVLRRFGAHLKEAA
ncbi:MAG: NAD-dependent epimerase/dehydratase family protein [Thermoleophilaceae bacterium]